VSYAGTKEETNMQTENAGRTGRRLLRALAAAVLVGLYCLSTVGIAMTTGVSTAQARGGRGGGRGGGSVRSFARSSGVARGVSRGAARGRGRRFVRGGGVYYGYGDDCWWSPRYGRWVCPYGY
jgi:hypothetical protein